MWGPSLLSEGRYSEYPQEEDISAHYQLIIHVGIA
jgi:hypothetical protein